MSDHVTLTGVRGDLREIMAESAAVLSLSLDPEAFGRTTLEALCLGRPLAGYAHGGVGEQLAALFPEGAVPAGDRRAMADKLAEWLRPGGGPRSTPGLNREFTLDRMLESTLHVYRELTASPR